MKMDLSTQLSSASEEYLGICDVKIDGGYVTLKNLASIFHTDMGALQRVPGWIEDTGIQKYPVSQLPFLVIRLMDRNVKIQEKQMALIDFLEFVGIPFVSPWGDPKVYIASHAESNKVKIGITYTPIKKRMNDNKRHYKGNLQTLFVMRVEGDIIEFDKNLKRRFAHLHTDPPNNKDHGVGKNEWYRFSGDIVAFISENAHRNLWDADSD